MNKTRPRSFLKNIDVNMKLANVYGNTGIKELLRYKWLLGSCLASIVLVVGGFVFGYAVLSKISQPIVIHFNDYVGINQIGNTRNLVFVGVLGLVMVVIDSWIAFTLVKREPFLGNIFGGMTLFLALLLFMGIMAIINVN